MPQDIQKQAREDGRDHEVTIQDVASRARVSASTVSNYLNGRFDRMRPETRERIDKAVQALAYSPNQLARQLKTGHVPMLGLIVPSVANPFWGSFAHHTEEAALTRGYQVLLGNSERDPVREERYAETLWSSGVRGLVFGSSSLSVDHLHDLARRGMQIVAFDRPSQGRDTMAVDSIGVDNVAGAKLAVTHLLELGHTRVGFISGPLRTVSRLARLEGYKAALREAGLELHPELVWEGATSTAGFGDNEAQELGRSGAAALLGLSSPPTALFAINDMYALGAYAGVRDAGLHVPQGVSIVGFDDIPLASLVDPPLTTVRQPLKRMMSTAVELLVGRVTGNATAAVEHLTLAPSLIDRSSTAAPAGHRG